MKILVISDSHGRLAALREAVQAQPDASMLLFLGDGDREIDVLRDELPPTMPLIAVRGNNDWASREPDDRVLEECGVRILMTHGHKYHVKWGLDEAIAAARAQNAQILLYGHTHVPFNEYRDGLYIMNPGSVGFPDMGPRTYGIIELRPQGILTNIVPIESDRDYYKL